ncbi:hypothetical protein EC988_003365 [Linderina pennispora]|nr:hypothetical protein EC988_003365 [Linderina pennispora]
MSGSPITSVSQNTAFPRPSGDSLSEYWPTRVTLNVRGRRFVLDRETINHLPDSLLSTMFPNGLVSLIRGYNDYPYYRDPAATSDDEAEHAWVDFDPDMLEYILHAYSTMLEFDLLADDSTEQQPQQAPQDSAEAAAPAAEPAEAAVPNDSMSSFSSGSHANTQSTSSSAVLNYMRFVANAGAPARTLRTAVYSDRSPLVVLREELDYFVIPESGRTSGDISNVEGFTLDMAKTRCAELLVEDDSVFEPLERTMQRNLENWRARTHHEGASEHTQALQSASVIEQQLIDMLCLAGFARDSRWGCRRIEPSRTTVTSLLSVPLDETADQARMIAAQKLLLFYKKPARKCWWEGEDVNAGDNEHQINLKLWCRRTWTLELVLI